MFLIFSALIASIYAEIIGPQWFIDHPQKTAQLYTVVQQVLNRTGGDMDYERFKSFVIQATPNSTTVDEAKLTQLFNDKKNPETNKIDAFSITKFLIDTTTSKANSDRLLPKLLGDLKKTHCGDNSTLGSLSYWNSLKNSVACLTQNHCKQFLLCSENAQTNPHTSSTSFIQSNTPLPPTTSYSRKKFGNDPMNDDSFNTNTPLPSITSYSRKKFGNDQMSFSTNTPLPSTTSYSRKKFVEDQDTSFDQSYRQFGEDDTSFEQSYRKFGENDPYSTDVAIASNGLQKRSVLSVLGSIALGVVVVALIVALIVLVAAVALTYWVAFLVISIIATIFGSAVWVLNG